MTAVQLLVMAKAPVPGRVKTRMCPPCTPEQAAFVAQAALADTIVAGSCLNSQQRTLVLSGQYDSPPGWQVVPQRGTDLGHRLASAFADTALAGVATLLIGMDTPQADARLLAAVVAGLDHSDAVVAPAEDGGWWALGLRQPACGDVLRLVPMSRADTGARTVAALRDAGLEVRTGPLLRDVDTADDAHAVAALCRSGRFAAAVDQHVPVTVR